MMKTSVQQQAFQTTVREYYRVHGRHDLPWRLPEPGGRFDPYKVIVSELMLQQTQVSRVIPKYEAFLGRFPTVSSLAKAPLADVLRAWSGLGYNRRAKFLHQASQIITDDYNGEFPQDPAALQTLPGIGPNTAGAILAYAFNEPVIFVETNVRTVFIHHFFHDQTGISDKTILELVSQTLDRRQPREWYWALMDYGSCLKQTVGNPNRRSRQYTAQSKFEGSRRQIRGQIIKLLGSNAYTKANLRQQIPDDRLESVIDELLQEGLITRANQQLTL
jgi:A/G-specific adenine glycosylase